MATRSKRLPEEKSEEEKNKSTNSPTLEELLEKFETVKKELDALKGEKKSDDSHAVAIGRSLDIRPDDYIKVISLCPYRLNLSTRPRGEGRVFGFEKFGEVKRIRYSDLVEILEVHDSFLRDGFFTILDTDIIQKHGLEEAYERILTKENIDKVLESNQSDAVNLFKNANERQQELIILMFIKKFVDGEEVNLNFLDRISRVVGYSIHDRAIQTKEQKESTSRSSSAD